MLEAAGASSEGATVAAPSMPTRAGGLLGKRGPAEEPEQPCAKQQCRARASRIEELERQVRELERQTRSLRYVTEELKEQCTDLIRSLREQNLPLAQGPEQIRPRADQPQTARAQQDNLRASSGARATRPLAPQPGSSLADPTPQEDSQSDTS